jgi:hypothetical protein
MKQVLLAATLMLTVACGDEQQPSTTTTTSAASSSSSGTPCTGDQGEVSGMLRLHDFFGEGGAAPAANTDVTFTPTNRDPGFVVRSGADGSYSAQLPADVYEVSGSSGNCVYPPIAPVPIESCKQVTVDILLEPCVGG